MNFKKKKEINGLLLIDKPINLSSNQVLQKIRFLFNAKKAGHIGTLDPLATGLLPICFGEATKFSEFLLNSKKRYYVTAYLGKKTDTLDSKGKIIHERKVNFTKEELYSSLKKFHGNILQIPPMYSAIKYKKKPLYKYAREGIKINRKKRKITIYKLKLIKIERNKLELDISCSKGTYIRSIIDDLGEILRCGAHVTHLRRVQVANFSIKNTVSLKKIYFFKKKYTKNIFFFQERINKYILPIISLFDNFHEINISSEKAFFFKNGQAIFIENKINIEYDKVKVTEGNEKKFIGIGVIHNQNKLIPYRLMNKKYI